MSAAQNSILQKQQNKMPTSMRYQRVQDILSNDRALSALLGPKTYEVQSRIGEHLTYCKEVVDVTNAIHAEGKDAQKVPKNDVLRMASRILKGLKGNGETAAAAAIPPVVEAPVTPLPVVTIVEDAPAKKKSKKAKATVVVTKKAPPPKPAKAQVTKAPKTAPAKPQPPAAKPAQQAGIKKGKTKPAQPVKLTKESSKKPAERAKPVSLAKDSVSKKSTPATVDTVPESELPPEKQPLHLPAAFDPKKYPHYDVQSTAYSLLLSLLTLVTHYEKYPGYEERQKKIESVLTDYLETCNQIKID